MTAAKERAWRHRDKPPLNKRDPKVQIDQPPFLDDEEEAYLLYACFCVSMTRWTGIRPHTVVMAAVQVH